MNFEELLAEFRALGGVASNFCLGAGERGRGLFVVDPAQPARIFVPENVLVPISEIEASPDALRVKGGAAIGPRERAFFDEYQRCFGWGAGGYEEVRREREAWSRLPADVTAFVQSMGVLGDPRAPFAPPDLSNCLQDFVDARDYDFRGVAHIAPILEIANHVSTAPGYEYPGNGVGASGVYPGEFLVRYNMGDAMANAIKYRFPDLSILAYSAGLVVDLPGFKLAVRRDFAQAEVRDGIRFPHVRETGDSVSLAFLTLGSLAAPDVPRGLFRELLASRLSASAADEVFDGIAHFNRKKFLDFVRLLDKHDGPVIGLLRDAALNQLEGLSSSVGARPISG